MDQIAERLARDYPLFEWRVTPGFNEEGSDDKAVLVTAQTDIGGRLLRVDVVRPITAFTEYMEATLQDVALTVAKAVGRKLVQEVTREDPDEEEE